MNATKKIGFKTVMYLKFYGIWDCIGLTIHLYFETNNCNLTKWLWDRWRNNAYHMSQFLSWHMWVVFFWGGGCCFLFCFLFCFFCIYKIKSYNVCLTCMHFICGSIKRGIRGILRPLLFFDEFHIVKVTKVGHGPLEPPPPQSPPAKKNPWEIKWIWACVYMYSFCHVIIQ